MFPRDYLPAWDTDVDDLAAAAVAGGGNDEINGETDVDTELGGRDADFSSSESEDEQWWQRPNPDNGTKVQVTAVILAFCVQVEHNFASF